RLRRRPPRHQTPIWRPTVPRRILSGRSDRRRSMASQPKREGGAKLEHRALGKSGLSVSAIGLGCMSLSGVYGAADDAESEKLIRHAIDTGVDHLDSSDMYGWGHNEQVLGRALKGRRDGVVVATKFGQT